MKPSQTHLTADAERFAVAAGHPPVPLPVWLKRRHLMELRLCAPCLDALLALEACNCLCDNEVTEHLQGLAEISQTVTDLLRVGLSNTLFSSLRGLVMQRYVQAVEIYATHQYNERPFQAACDTDVPRICGPCFAALEALAVCNGLVSKDVYEHLDSLAEVSQTVTDLLRVGPSNMPFSSLRGLVMQRYVQAVEIYATHQYNEQFLQADRDTAAQG